MSSGWFYLGQSLFLIWNSVNDPLLGMALDWVDRHGLGTSVGRRLPAIRIAGPMCAAVFGLMWLPIGCFWGDCGKEPNQFQIFVFFVVSMCAYDGLFTFLVLAHSAIIADVTIDPTQRMICNRWQALFAMAAAVSVVLGTFFWNFSMTSFRIFVGIVCSCSAFGTYFSTFFIMQHVAHVYQPEEITPMASMLIMTSQLLSLKSFRVVACVGFLQQFMCAFNNGFWIIFYDIVSNAPFLVDNGVSEVNHFTISLKTILVGVAFVVPHILTIYFNSFFENVGNFAQFNSFFILRLCSIFITVVLLMFTSAHLSFFLVVNRVLTELVCRSMSLVNAQVVDDDFIVNRRDATRSSSIIGWLNFLNKPAVSLAPMLGWMVLKNSGHVSSEFSIDIGSNLYVASVLLLVLIPLVFVGLQFIIWQYFPLKDNKIISIFPETAAKSI